MSGLASFSLSPPRYWPDENGAGGEDQRPVRCWRVLHACGAIGETASVAEAQIEVGMRPSLLTPNGWYRPLIAASEPATALSLIHEWQEVRRWRQRFTAEMVEQWAEVLHAHCFAAGMAGLRGSAPVVYDFVNPIGAGIEPRAGAWLLRSLRAAEQFLLSRADALVVHSRAMWSEALGRGVSAEDLFLVPDPVEAADWSADMGHGPGVTLFAPVDEKYELLIQAFATLVSQIDNARLVLEVAPHAAKSVLRHAGRAGVAASVDLIGPSDRERAMALADIVIAVAPHDYGPGAIVISALAHGRAVLAADVAQNREVTPQGRGCLWYRNHDARDLAGRAAFLARNPDFRAALVLSGRAHLQATRTAKVVGRKYDEVYRHAFQRRHGGTANWLRQLQAVRASL